MCMIKFDIEFLITDILENQTVLSAAALSFCCFLVLTTQVPLDLPVFTTCPIKHSVLDLLLPPNERRRLSRNWARKSSTSCRISCLAKYYKIL